MLDVQQTDHLPLLVDPIEDLIRERAPDPTVILITAEIPPGRDLGHVQPIPHRQQPTTTPTAQQWRNPMLGLLAVMAPDLLGRHPTRLDQVVPLVRVIRKCIRVMIHRERVNRPDTRLAQRILGKIDPGLEIPPPRQQPIQKHLTRHERHIIPLVDVFPDRSQRRRNLRSPAPIMPRQIPALGPRVDVIPQHQVHQRQNPVDRQRRPPLVPQLPQIIRRPLTPLEIVDTLRRYLRPFLHPSLRTHHPTRMQQHRLRVLPGQRTRRQVEHPRGTSRTHHVERHVTCSSRLFRRHHHANHAIHATFAQSAPPQPPGASMAPQA